MKKSFVRVGLYLLASFILIITSFSFTIADTAPDCIGTGAWDITAYSTIYHSCGDIEMLTASCDCFGGTPNPRLCRACDDYATLTPIGGHNVYVYTCFINKSSCACFNSICEPQYGETCSTCSADCGACCTPRTCSYYTSQGLCNATFSNGCSGTLSSCYSNCSINQPCTQTTNCQTGGICVSGFCVTTKLNTTYWADMMGNKINETDDGDSVLMIYGGYLLEGKVINYTIQEYNSSSVWWNLFGWLKDWNTANKISSGNAYEPWIISNTYKKRFNATTVGASNISGNLTVRTINNNQTIISGVSPLISGVSPLGGAVYSAGYNISFNQSSTDQDDLLKITWDFGDGTNAIFYNYSSYINSTSANTRHSYSQPGIYTWKISAQGMTRGDEVSETRTVRVLEEGINVVPIVTSPANGAAYGARWVQFNASQTYVVNCTSGIMINNPVFKTDDGLWNCSFVHAPGATQTTSAYNLTFNWNLGDGNSVSGDLDANYSQAVVFRYRYSTSGRHVVNLNVRCME